MLRRIVRFFKALYLKIVRVNDSPQKVAAGFGVGVFLGVMPGMGPIAALACALLFRLNKASALLGSILTNTWISIPVFFVSVQIGSVMTGSSFAEIDRQWAALAGHFTWSELLHASLYKIAIPVLIGYAVVSTLLALAAYAFALIVLLIKKRAHAAL